jgi:DnaJ family protein C protein 17
MSPTYLHLIYNIRGDDLYALLGVDATTPAEDIHRAWKRATLRSHPDRAGIHYDAGKYELLRRAPVTCSSM